MPRGVYEAWTKELKQTLMDDDCYLPWNVRQVPVLTQQASLSAPVGDPEPLRNGLDRPIDGADNGWTAPLGEHVTYTFDQVQRVRALRLVFDSDLNRPEKNEHANRPLAWEPVGVPQTLVRAFRVEALGPDGTWRVAFREHNNYQRLVRVDLDLQARALRLVPEATWGANEVHLFAWDVA